MAADMHPTLIRANVALYLGDYAEVRRLLADYRAEGGGAAEHAPMALWLDAHAQSEPDERLRRLEALVTVVPPDNTYARLAQHIIDTETPARQDEPRGIGRRGVAFIGLASFVLLVVIMAVVMRPQNTVVPDVPPTATVAPTAAPLPDRSRPLTASAYTATYAGGILQVTAVENDSQRIVGRDGVQVQPVPGARFYAAELAFECRAPICQRPPDADIALRLADDSRIQPRTEVFVQGESSLQPVALGVTTRGWVVFEIPSIIAVSGLDVYATDSDGQPLSITISLN